MDGQHSFTQNTTWTWEIANPLILHSGLLQAGPSTGCCICVYESLSKGRLPPVHHHQMGTHSKISHWSTPASWTRAPQTFGGHDQFDALADTPLRTNSLFLPNHLDSRS
jgi:hypothetical protein